MPASSAAWMMRIDSSWSGLPHEPNIITPRHSLLTETPVRPRGRSSMSGLGGVLVVGHVLAPGHRAPGLVELLHRDVGHEAVRCGAVPVVLATLEEDAVAGADRLDGAALALAEADALGDEDRLAVRVGVPGGAGTGREVHERGGERGGTGGRGDGVDVDVAGEPVGGTLLGFDAAVGDLHARS